MVARITWLAFLMVMAVGGVLATASINLDFEGLVKLPSGNCDSCNDNNECTVDICAGGQCFQAALYCDDHEECTAVRQDVLTHPFRVQPQALTVLQIFQTFLFIPSYEVVTGDLCTSCETVWDEQRPVCIYERQKARLLGNLELLATVQPLDRCLPDNWVFEPGQLNNFANIARAVLTQGGDYQAAFDALHGALLQFALESGANDSFPLFINVKDVEQGLGIKGDFSFPTWRYNFAGSITIQVSILYASLTEYLIIIAAPIGATPGFGGRYPKVEFYDFMLAGELATSTEGDMNPHFFSWPPQNVEDTNEYNWFTPANVGNSYTCPNNCYVLEYARGNILSLLEFGLFAPTESWTRDYLSTVEKIRSLGQSIGGNCFPFVQS
ncbi:Sigma non-opioid intracellular receptor 1 [Balamuthia mandrillaris]